MVEISPLLRLKSDDYKSYDPSWDDGLQKEVFHEISENLRASQRKLQEIRNLMTFSGRHDDLSIETDEIAQNQPLTTADGVLALLADSEQEVFNYYIQPLNKNNNNEGEEFETPSPNPNPNPAPTKIPKHPILATTTDPEAQAQGQPRPSLTDSPHFPTLQSKEYRDSSHNQFETKSQATINYETCSKDKFNYNSSATYGLEGAFCGEGQQENSQKKFIAILTENNENIEKIEKLERQNEALCSEILKREIEAENRKKADAMQRGELHEEIKYFKGQLKGVGKALDGEKRSKENVLDGINCFRGLNSEVKVYWEDLTEANLAEKIQGNFSKYAAVIESAHLAVES